jgi:hypothetical protein
MRGQMAQDVPIHHSLHIRSGFFLAVARWLDDHRRAR